MNALLLVTFVVLFGAARAWAAPHNAITNTPPATQDAHADAVRLARSGAHEEALRRFEELIAANPKDLESSVCSRL
jgi:hypothetical protein